MTKGKDIYKTVRFCCLAAFLRKSVKNIKLIICDNVSQHLVNSCYQRSVKFVDQAVKQGVILSVSLFFRLQLYLVSYGLTLISLKEFNA